MSTATYLKTELGNMFVLLFKDLPNKYVFKAKQKCSQKIITLKSILNSAFIFLKEQVIATWMPFIYNYLGLFK